MPWQRATSQTTIWQCHLYRYHQSPTRSHSKQTTLTACADRVSPQTYESVQAKEFYLGFLERLRKQYVAERVKDGVFGAMMEVSLVNDVGSLCSCIMYLCSILVQVLNHMQH